MPRSSFDCRLVLFAIFAVSLFSVGVADEGMFPISGIKSLKLREKGLEITPEEIFSLNKTCLVDGVCRVNGCTGSFVSPDGLIFTNHHCAYRAIQSASSKGNDYLKNGFSALTRTKEIPAKGVYRTSYRIVIRRVPTGPVSGHQRDGFCNPLKGN